MLTGNEFQAVELPCENARSNRSFYYHSALVLWNSIPSVLSHVAHHITPSPILDSPVSDLSTSLIFLKRWKSISFTVPFLLSLHSPRPSQDWYLRYRSSFIVSCQKQFAIIYANFIHANLIYFIIITIIINERYWRDIKFRGTSRSRNKIKSNDVLKFDVTFVCSVFSGRVRVKSSVFNLCLTRLDYGSVTITFWFVL